MAKPDKVEVPLTEDPDDDAYPHYHGSEEVSGYIHVGDGLVYADEIPGLGPAVVGVGPWDEYVDLSIESGTGSTTAGLGVKITPETARKLIRSLELSIEWAEKYEEEASSDGA